MTTQSNRKDLGSIINDDSLPAYIVNKRAERMWDWAADRYAAKPVTDENAYAHKLAITRNYLHLEANVLELGCGTGSTALAHAHHVNHIKAIDVSSRMIEIAKSKAASASVDNIDFAHSDVDHLQLADDCFDVVLMLNLLHILADWRKHITMAYNTLKPGGVFVSSTSCLGDGYTLIRLPVIAGRMVGILPKFSFFTREELEYALVDAGFEIEYTSEPARKTAAFLVARKP